MNATYAHGGARDLILEYVTWSLNCLSFLVAPARSNKTEEEPEDHTKEATIRKVLLVEPYHHQPSKSVVALAFKNPHPQPVLLGG